MSDSTIPSVRETIADANITGDTAGVIETITGALEERDQAIRVKVSNLLTSYGFSDVEADEMCNEFGLFEAEPESQLVTA